MNQPPPGNSNEKQNAPDEDADESSALDPETTRFDRTNPGGFFAPLDSKRAAAGKRMGIRFESFGMTDVGQVREHNEDNFVMADFSRVPSRGLAKSIFTGELREAGALFAVCDGMGGAAAGEVASQMAVDTIAEQFARDPRYSDRDEFAREIVAAIEEAGARIHVAARQDRERRGMGTTATVAGLVDKVLFIGQVGDSRCYVLRNGKLSQITKDQSLVNQLIEAGQLTQEEAEDFEHSNIILQALGTNDRVEVDLTFLELRKGDRLLLCSDGLSGMVPDELIEEVLREVRGLEAAVRRLIKMANEAGGDDNITCVIVDIDGEALETVEADAPAPFYQQYPLVPASLTPGGPSPDSDVTRPSVLPTAPKESSKNFRSIFWLVAIVAFGLLFWIWQGWEQEVFKATRGAQKRLSNERVATQEEDPGVEVHIQTDLTSGELFVDGKSFGPISGDLVILELQPGSHLIEVVGGEARVSQQVELEGDSPQEVVLNRPPTKKKRLEKVRQTKSKSRDP